MRTQEIPLTPNNQQFYIDIDGATYLIRTLWRDDAGWVLDLADAYDTTLLAGIPLIPGVDLLAQYPDLGIKAALIVATDKGAPEYPTVDNLGRDAHLLTITESS
nr:hypothetical protein [uncultured Enterobacter sp.]